DSPKYKSFQLPGAKPQYNPDRYGQVTHIALDLKLDIPNQICSGTCTTALNPIRNGITSIVMDAVDMEIISIQVSNEVQKYDYDGKQITIELTHATTIGNPISLEIAYKLDKPDRGMYFVQPNEYFPNKPTQVWTQGEDEDSRYWFPCFDYPGQLASSEIRVEVPSSFTAISNGKLDNVEDKSDSKIYHWIQTEVHPTYLMTLAVGEFSEIRDEWNGKDITYYFEKGKDHEARLTMGKTPRMVEFFSQTYGYPYAYPKYAQVCVDDFIFGGMENTSTTLLTDRCLIDDRAAIDNLRAETLVAHELAHQWFGDLVVIKHWSHAWVKEGAATYAEVLWLTHEYSSDLGRYYWLGQAREYLDEDSSRYRRPLVTHVYREAIELYDRHIYEKGACVYHMMRIELGDELFFKTMATFLHDNAHNTVETIDLLRAVEKTTGRNLTFLFDQYVYRGGHPDYKVEYSWDNDSKLAKVAVTQTQVNDGETDGLFDLKIPIGFTTNTVNKTFTVRIHQREQAFYFPLESKPDFVSFDVGNNTLKTVELAYPLPELSAQLVQDPDCLSRLNAAESIAKKGNLEALKTLEKALSTEVFWGVRLEIVEAIATIKLDQVGAILTQALQDPEARVRRAAIIALADQKTAAAYQSVKAIVEAGDPSYTTESSAIAALGTFAMSGLPDAPDESEVLGILKSILETRDGWNQVVRSGAISALSKMKTSSAALDLLQTYTNPAIPQSLRLAAIRALGAISTGQMAPQIEQILNRLRELSCDRFFFTQLAVISSLGQMETTKAIPLLNSFVNLPDGRVKRMAEEAIQRVQSKSGSDASVKQLREELDSLKKDNKTLTSRLEALEAKG
ncbi:MAG: M1 family metallopeptidase, partial [Cyanobacteria bacterium]|nr:M1 family metallopeptidase [Cyanobacteriota bacterium]